MEREIQTQLDDQKTIDPYVALQKIMRLIRKHMNFEYEDLMLSVRIPIRYIPLPETTPGEHLLKQFWRHVQTFYFKPISVSEIQRLNYIHMLISPPINRELPFKTSKHFWGLVEATFSRQYLSRKFQSDEKSLDQRNWYCVLYSYYIILQNRDNLSYKRQKQQLRKIQESKLSKSEINNSKEFIEDLERQQRNLKRILPDKLNQSNQVSIEINKLQRQLRQINQSNRNIFNKLNSRVQDQISNKQIYCINDDKIQYHQSQQQTQKQSINHETIQIIKNLDIKLKYLQYIILLLQKKQVAQSISRILSLQKSRGQYKFIITFENAMNINPKLMKQQQVIQFNNLRQYSLLKFYNTSLKSKYSFICQNFLGFKEIFNNRNQPCPLKDKNIIQAMKTSNYIPKEKINKQFLKFQICHHCKLLYPQNLLVSCKYTSTKLGAPIHPSPYYDPYLTQIAKNQQGICPQRFTIRKRNCFMSYTKNEQQEYSCLRKFCKYCLKQNYQEGIDKNGLCPFCQGICFCTRCSRNDMISRLKSMYILFGGSIKQLEKESQLQKLQKFDQDVPQTRKILKIKKPLKRVNTHIGRQYQKISSIRFSMEDCRMLCDMVKRRQKHKAKLVQIKSQNFSQKIKIISKDYDGKRLLSNIEWDDNNSSDQQMCNLEKIRKRLHNLS